MSLAGQWRKGFSAPDVTGMLAGATTYGAAVDRLLARLNFQKATPAQRAALLTFLGHRAADPAQRRRPEERLPAPRAAARAHPRRPAPPAAVSATVPSRPADPSDPPSCRRRGRTGRHRARADSTDFVDCAPRRPRPATTSGPRASHAGCDCGHEDSSPDPWRRGFTRRRVVQGTTAMVAALGLQTVTTRYAFAPARPSDSDTRRRHQPARRLGRPQHRRADLRGPLLPAAPEHRGAEGRRAAARPRLRLAPGAQAAARPVRGRQARAVVSRRHAGHDAVSHFEAMDTLERGTATPGTPLGWLNRVLQARGEDGVFWPSRWASSLPLSLAGDAPALSMDGIQSFGLAGFDDVKAKAAYAVRRALQGHEAPDGRPGARHRRRPGQGRLDRGDPGGHGEGVPAGQRPRRPPSRTSRGSSRPSSA